MSTASLRRSGAALILLLSLVLALTLTSEPAHAATYQPAMSTATLGDRVLNKAESKAGVWYAYGAAGPYNFDCSGLVYWAAGQLGISLPRTTYGMLAGSSHLYRIPLSWARRGDLMFYGSGHVEINTGWYHTTFGAQRTGTRVWWHPWSGYWAPTMAMRLR
jgi:cell wall-associated NlpC family hydrolase